MRACAPSLICMRDEIKVKRQSRSDLIEAAHQALRVMRVFVRGSITTADQRAWQVDLGAIDRRARSSGVVTNRSAIGVTEASGPSTGRESGGSLNVGTRRTGACVTLLGGRVMTPWSSSASSKVKQDWTFNVPLGFFQSRCSHTVSANSLRLRLLKV